MANFNPPAVNLVTCGKWHLANTAVAFAARDALAGLYLSDNDRTSLPREKIHRCWRFHLAMKLFYSWAPQITIEHAFYAFQFVWQGWLRAQNLKRAEVVQAISGFATEVFDQVENSPILKVIDAPNSHPRTYHARWQEECDRWCPGEKVPVPGWMLQRMAREIARADVVLCPSLFVRDSMIENGVAPAKCFLNPFGVNTSLFRPRKSPPAKPRFISVGTICVRKGFPYLFRAFELVKKRIPDAELVVVGGYKTDFRMERRRWEGSFTRIDHIDHQALAEILGTCTAFVFPSIEEGFARVIPEAMASGLPIIATHESGATTLVQHGCEGLIVPARDITSTAEAMIELALDPQRNTRMGLAAHERGAARNSWQDYGDRLLAEYADRIAGRKAALK